MPEHSTAVDMWAVGCIFAGKYSCRLLRKWETFMNILIQKWSWVASSSRADQSRDRSRLSAICSEHHRKRYLLLVFIFLSPQGMCTKKKGTGSKRKLCGWLLDKKCRISALDFLRSFLVILERKKHFCKNLDWIYLQILSSIRCDRTRRLIEGYGALEQRPWSEICAPPDREVL